MQGVMTRPLARYAPLWPFLNWGLFALGTLLIVGIMVGVIPYGPHEWRMGDGAAWYFMQTPYDWTDRPDGVAEYRYSPAFLWITEPFRWLPFELYRVVWVGLHLAAIAWLGPWTILLAFDDVVVGNVNTFLAVAVVIAASTRQSPFRSAAWSFVLLTKVTPGVGALVHIGRREWWAAGIAIGATLAIVAIGALIQPNLWLAWFDSLSSGQSTYANVWTASLLVRLPIAAALCLAAARWVWLLPVGMIVAMPGLWPATFAMLAAVPRLLQSASNSTTANESAGSEAASSAV